MLKVIWFIQILMGKATYKLWWTANYIKNNVGRVASIHCWTQLDVNFKNIFK